MKWTGAPLRLDLFQESLGWHTGRQEGIMGGGEGERGARGCFLFYHEEVMPRI